VSSTTTIEIYEQHIKSLPAEQLELPALIAQRLADSRASSGEP
jgi:hypothetical protein